ncbi:MAG: NFACT family protein [Pyrinomonadaceae bacterium]
MHHQTLKDVVIELETILTGRFLGKVFQLSELSLAMDFGVKAEGYLLINVEPAAPRLYLIKRTSRQMEKSSATPLPFAQALRANLGGARLAAVTQDAEERIVRFLFSVNDDLGDTRTRVLVAQLTGRSANLLLLNSEGCITHALRKPKGDGQQMGGQYRPPKAQASAVLREPLVVRGKSPSISAAADEYYRRAETEHEFAGLAARLRANLRKEITRRRKLKINLQKDLVAHGNPEAHKRLGDLLLANISNAQRQGSKVTVNDYYAEGSPAVVIEIDENKSLQDAASEAFSRYTKAKRAIEEISGRSVELDRELVELEKKQMLLEKAIASDDASALASFHDKRDKSAPTHKTEKASIAHPGTRRYLSSDGYEVLVGRTARDNDALTFRVARPNDLWLHAGDYPGSHVVVRNSSRKEIPQRTVIEAAQLAAKFSRAAKDSKVAIHYTLRKFLSKPKRSAPGLVRVSSFKTITVEPAENIERIK